MFSGVSFQPNAWVCAWALSGLLAFVTRAQVLQTTGTTESGGPAPTFLSPAASQGSFSLAVPGGSVRIGVTAASSITPESIRPTASLGGFRPPSVFSPPAPVGSGARALGFGAFVAIADDATAASWNPAGLMRLESREASVVLRSRQVRLEHESDTPTTRAGTDRFESSGLNFLSFAQPVGATARSGPWVWSVNLHEAYDFANRFRVETFSTSAQSLSRMRTGTAGVRQEDIFSFQQGTQVLTVQSAVDTRSESRLDQRALFETEADLDFRQQGILYSFSPALGFRLHPTWWTGLALNLYQEGDGSQTQVRSSTRSRYRTRARTDARITNRQSSLGRYESVWSEILPPAPPFPGGTLQSPGPSGAIPGFTAEESRTIRREESLEGEYIEENRYEDFRGMNLTLGTLWHAHRRLTLGLAVDLPWQARARQTRTLTERQTRVSADGQRSATTETFLRDEQDVRFHFPLEIHAGLAIHWTPAWTTALDLGYTDGSGLFFESPSTGKSNILDGSPHAENPLEDAWTLRVGTEYLWQGGKHPLPLRLGVLREESPAPGDARVMTGFSLGTGYPIPIGDKTLWLDIAYSQRRSQNPESWIPDLPELKSSNQERWWVLSGILHF